MHLIRAEATTAGNIEVMLSGARYGDRLSGIPCPLYDPITGKRNSGRRLQAQYVFRGRIYSCGNQIRSSVFHCQTEAACRHSLLENTLSRAFTADRITVLELMAAQAAISLENSVFMRLLRAGADLQLQVGLLQQLPVSAWTLEPDGTPDFVNQVWLEFSGQTLDFVRSHPEAWMTAVHPGDRESAAKTFWEGVHSGQGFAFEIRSLRARDGIYRRHLQQAVVLRDQEGQVLKFVGTTTDIDDQKRAEEALRQTRRSWPTRTG